MWCYSSEKLIKDMADRMAADGFLKAGYEYIIIDDCWLAKDRAADGQLQADPKRFPGGIKPLADYVSVSVLRTCHPGSYCWGYYLGTLICSQVSTT